MGSQSVLTRSAVTGSTDNLVVVLDHPHGEVEVPFERWVDEGPGARDLVEVVALRHVGEEQRLSANALALAYRNSPLSRMLIRLHLLRSPWAARRA